MALLKAVVATLEEVAEPFRTLYTERNGKFEFTGVEGIKTQADIDRQLAANQKVRTDLTAAQTALNEAKTKLQAWEELDPEDVKTKLEKLETYEAGKNVPELMKNFETTVKSRVETLLGERLKGETTKLQRTVDDLTKKLGDATVTIGDYVTKDNTRSIHDAVRSAAVTSKVLPEAVGDLLAIAGMELKLVDGKAQTEDGRDPAAWLEDRKQRTPYLWPTAQGAGGRGADGGPAGGGDNPFLPANHNMTKIGQLVSSNPVQAAKMAEVAGVPKDAAGNYIWHQKPAPAAK